MLEINNANPLPKTGLVLVDYYATWCGPCRMLSPILESLVPAVPKVRFMKLNVDEQDNDAGVSALPTLILYRDGVEIDRKVGLVPKPALVAWLSNY